MGSSAKKKKEKKKDFQKVKLKVGKTKAKAANATDTSFKAKGMLLQSFRGDYRIRLGADRPSELRLHCNSYRIETAVSVDACAYSGSTMRTSSVSSQPQI
jgi:hypothetical protein